MPGTWEHFEMLQQEKWESGKPLKPMAFPRIQLLTKKLRRDFVAIYGTKVHSAWRLATVVG